MQAARPGPIKGVTNRVWDAPSGSMQIGRYGWKANVATIAHQTAGAFLGDISAAIGAVIDSYGMVALAVDRGSAAQALRLQAGDAVYLYAGDDATTSPVTLRTAGH